MKDKLCPVKFTKGSSEPFENGVLCEGSRCQWWTSAYTTEGIEIWDCAMVIGAKSNSDGKIPV